MPQPCMVRTPNSSASVLIIAGGQAAPPIVVCVRVENLAMAHPAVLEAAVIACCHPKWDERPLLIVVKKPDQEVTREQLLAFYDGKVAKWWIPDDVVFVDELPHTATGKLSKLRLREQFKDYRLPGC